MKLSTHLSSSSIVAVLPLLIAGAARADASPLDVPAPAITVLESSPQVAEGLIFIAPKITSTTEPQGPEIIDDQGRPVWFRPLRNGDQAADFRVQRYRGERVLTWSEGQGLGGVQTTPTVDYVLDASYQVVATVRAGNGYNADSHEFRLTPYGTALVTIYHPVPYDLSPYGGPKDGTIVDGIAQEIDVATGRVVFEWHSLDHVGVDESHAPVPTTNTPYDYFHINAVNLDLDGNLIVSSRAAWTIYKLDHRSGDVLWRLGGKKSDFALGEGVQFAYQHDPEPAGRDTLRIFDNEAAPAVLPYSRVVWVHYDTARKTATLVRSIEHPAALQAPSQGNSQALENGDTFVGWGALGRFSEFDREGNLLFDATVPSTPAGYDDYRAYRFEWRGRPASAPTVVASATGEGTSVHAIWNGATDVARWVVLGGPGAGSLRPIAATAWNGLDTSVAVDEQPAYVAVVALDASGRIVGRSEVAALTK
jgi:hypothetical protein